MRAPRVRAPPRGATRGRRGAAGGGEPGEEARCGCAALRRGTESPSLSKLPHHHLAAVLSGAPAPSPVPALVEPAGRDGADPGEGLQVMAGARGLAASLGVHARLDE